MPATMKGAISFGLLHVPISLHTATQDNDIRFYQANMMNSHYEYKPGSATAEYRAMVDEAASIAEKQKTRTDPMYHEKIDRLLDTYARKLADNFNENFEIQTRCPSVLISGRANFPIRKKEKQNAASDRNMEEYRRIQGLLDKIRSTGMGGVSSDDDNAVAKLKVNLESRERAQEEMKAVNAYYRRNGTLQGCPLLTQEDIAKLETQMSRSFRQSPKPYESFLLSNNNAEIHRLRARITELEQRRTTPAPEGWAFNGGEVVMNREENRVAGVTIQIKHIESGRTYSGVTEETGAIQFTDLKPGAYDGR